MIEDRTKTSFPEHIFISLLLFLLLLLILLLLIIKTWGFPHAPVSCPFLTWSTWVSFSCRVVTEGDLVSAFPIPLDDLLQTIFIVYKYLTRLCN